MKEKNYSPTREESFLQNSRPSNHDHENLEDSEYLEKTPGIKDGNKIIRTGYSFRHQSSSENEGIQSGFSEEKKVEIREEEVVFQHLEPRLNPKVS